MSRLGPDQHSTAAAAGLFSLSFPSAAPSRRIVSLAIVAAAFGVLACLWAAWCEFPFYAWNDVRLAPAFALRHGINPYPGEGGGPLSTWIYGPIGIVVNLPATFAPTAQSALQTAFVINAVVVLVPFAIIFLGAVELRGRGLLFCALGWLLTALLLPRPNLVLQVADHTAIALGLLSCWILARDSRPSTQRLATGAALCALAIWSKQITSFLLPAQIAFLWISAGRKPAIGYIAWTVGFGLCCLAIFSGMFGFRNLWLNLVAIPGQFPWADLWSRTMLRPWSLLAQILIPAGILILIWQREWWPDRTRESGRFFQIAVLAAIAMLPVGLAGFYKIGGDTNLLHSWDYLLPALLLLWLARDNHPTQLGPKILGIVVVALLVRTPELMRLPPQSYTAHLTVAADLTTKFPNALWFPQHPVLTFYSDGRLWHTEDGIRTRHIAGYGIREADFRRHIPPSLQGMVYPAVADSPFVLPLMPEYNQVVKIPYWTLHIPADPNLTAPK